MQPIIPTTIEMMGCQAVANEATAAAPVIVVSVLAAESVCCIIYHKDSNYPRTGSGTIQYGESGYLAQKVLRYKLSSPEKVCTPHGFGKTSNGAKLAGGSE
jgi:hypothetical protein